MNSQRRAYLYGIGAVLLWSTVASAFKISLRYLDPLQLLFYSSLASSALLAGIVAGSGRIAELRCTPKQLGRSLLLGTLNPLVYYSVLFEDPDGIRLEINHVPGKGLLAK